MRNDLQVCSVDKCRPLSCIRFMKVNISTDVESRMGVARIFQRGGHTDSYIGYSPNCHLNIVGCLLTKRLTKGGVTGTPGPPLATPLITVP